MSKTVQNYYRSIAKEGLEPIPKQLKAYSDFIEATISQVTKKALEHI